MEEPVKPLPKKTPSQSRTEISRIVRPLDANTLGTGYGGYIMDWMDMAASICARRHTNLRVNTVMVESLRFKKPIRIGHVAKIVAVATRSFNTSMEVKVDLYDEDTYNDTIELAGTATFVLVGLDDKCRPTKVPELVPETEEEKQLWLQAGERREKRKREQMENI